MKSEIIPRKSVETDGLKSHQFEEFKKIKKKRRKGEGYRSERLRLPLAKVRSMASKSFAINSWTSCWRNYKNNYVHKFENGEGGRARMGGRRKGTAKDVGEKTRKEKKKR